MKLLDSFMGRHSWKFVALISLFFSLAAFLIHQVYEFDVWWHVAIGRDILENFSIPGRDQFAAGAMGRPYHDSHWLFQVGLATADRMAGMVGVQLMMIGVWSLTLFACHRSISRWVQAPLNHLLLFFAAMASVERFLPRPEIVTFLMIALFWWFLQERRYLSVGNAMAIAALQVLWTNCHGLFVIGPFMVGCYWLTAAVRKPTGADEDFPALSRLLILVLSASLISPFGLDGWRYAMLLSSEAGPKASKLFQGISELSPTFGAATRSGMAFWFFLALLILAALTTAASLLSRKVPVARLLVASGLCFAALTGRRNMVLFALVAAPLAAENLRFLLPWRFQENRLLALVSAAAMLTLAWFPLSGEYYLRMEIPSRFGWGATPSFFPHRLPEFMKRTGFQGQVLNSNSIGGFYLYHSYPERIPLTDGRWEIYDPKVLEKIQRAPQDPLLWKWLVSTFDIRGLILQHASPEARNLLPTLSGSSLWRLAYYDYAASFWLRSDLPEPADAVDMSGRAELPGSPARVDDCLILNNFLKNMGANELRLRNLEQGLGFEAGTESLLEEMGSTLISLERYAEAEHAFRRLHQESPRNPKALNELAFLAFRRNDLQEAESLLRRALDMNPESRDAQANYQRVRSALERSGTTASGENR